MHISKRTTIILVSTAAVSLFSIHHMSSIHSESSILLDDGLIATADDVAVAPSSSSRSAVEALRPAGPEESEAAALPATVPTFDSVAQAVISEVAASPQLKTLAAPSAAHADTVATQADQV